MKIRFNCFYCNSEEERPLIADVGGYFDIPRLFCPKCLKEVAWEVIDENTGATRAISDDSGDRL